MKAQLLTIHADTGVVDVPRGLVALHGTAFVLRCAFLTNGQPAAIPDYVSDSLRLGLKLKGAPNADTSLIGLGDWVVSGSGATTRYELTVTMDSVQLRAALGNELSLDCVAQIAWGVDEQDDERKSFVFPVTVVASVTLPEDAAPDTSTADALAWLLAALTVSGGLVKTSGPTTVNIASGRSSEKKVSSTPAPAGSYTTIFSITIPAGATCKLDVWLINVEVKSGHYMYAQGTLPAGVTAVGSWSPMVTTGDLTAAATDVFTGTPKIIDNTDGEVDVVLNALPQTFLLANANGTDSTVTVKAQGSGSDGVIGAGSFYVLQRL